MLHADATLHVPASAVTGATPLGSLYSSMNLAPMCQLLLLLLLGAGQAPHGD